jgi:serine/threonine protein kinase
MESGNANQTTQAEIDSVALPQRIGRYRILRTIGQGGMGVVYLAQDEQLERQVALKVPQIGATDSRKERFLREARAAATLTHPNICPVYDVGEADGKLFLTMAYIEGKTLFDEISTRPMQQRRAASLVGKLAMALAEAHAHGIIHRDLKPANVLINARGDPVLTDFGLARRIQQGEERLTQSGMVIGTPAYMAPEQVNGDNDSQGPCTDVYSLGTVLYEMLTGRPPFVGQLTRVLVQIVNEPPEPPSALRPDLDSELEAICLRCMAKKPQGRFASMKELAAALNGYLRRTSSTAKALPPTPPAAPAAAYPVKMDTPTPPALAPPAEARPSGSRPKDRLSGAVLTVSQLGRGDFRSLGEALRACPPRGRIEVEPGLYRERLVLTQPVEIVGKGPPENITLEGAEGACLVMQADYAMVHGLTLHCRASASNKRYPTVDIGQGHLVLEKCRISSDSLACVAVYGSSADPILRGCLIHHGKECGILFMQQGRGTLEDCDIVANTLSNVEIKTEAAPVLRRCKVHQGKAGGVLIWDHARGTLEDCDISDNALSGVEIKGGADPLLRGCKIRDGRQCGVFVWAFAQGRLENCEVRDNALSGIEVKKMGKLAVQACMIVRNQAWGVWVHEGGAARIKDCILIDNRQGPWEIEPGCKIQRTGNRGK